MDIKAKIEEIVEKVKTDKTFADKFQKDPIKTVEDLARLLHVTPQHTVKTLCYMANMGDEEKFFVFRGRDPLFPICKFGKLWYTVIENPGRIRLDIEKERRNEPCMTY